MDDILNTGPLVMEKTGLAKNTLDGEVAVVTGGTSNIGLATARSLAWLGAKVVLAARRPDRGAAAAALIDEENQPGTALFVPTDVSDESSMKEMAKKAFDTYGKVDILVNNAMDMSLGAPILKSTVEQMDRQYEIAVRGALLGIQQFVPGMQERKHGVVTYIATLLHHPMGPSNYDAIKAAAASVILSLASEVGPVEENGVAVFTYIPGLVFRPRPEQERTGRGSPMAMAGYPGAYPPEDCGAALAYSIVRAADIHGSGIMIGQAFAQMDWEFPKPETAPKRDFDRISETAEVRIFGYMGPGFPEPRLPLVSLNRSDSPKK